MIIYYIYGNLIVNQNEYENIIVITIKYNICKQILNIMNKFQNYISMEVYQFNILKQYNNS